MSHCIIDSRASYIINSMTTYEELSYAINVGKDIHFAAGFPFAPEELAIPDLCSKILEQSDSLDMGSWCYNAEQIDYLDFIEEVKEALNSTECGSTLCAAGFACAFSEDKIIRKLYEYLSNKHIRHAAAIIWYCTYGKIPCFYMSNYHMLMYLKNKNNQIKENKP